MVTNITPITPPSQPNINDSTVNKSTTTVDIESEIPEALKDPKIKTKVKKFSEIVKLTLDKLEDLATLEILMEVSARVRNRLKTLKKLGQARNIKIRGDWKTFPPKFHTTPPKATKISRDEFHIVYEIYEGDGNGNKLAKENRGDPIVRDGVVISNEVKSITYPFVSKVTEKIISGKSIEREIFVYDNK